MGTRQVAIGSLGSLGGNIDKPQKISKVFSARCSKQRQLNKLSQKQPTSGAGILLWLNWNDIQTGINTFRMPGDFWRICSPCAPAEARRWILFDFSQGNLENLVGNLKGILRIFLIHWTKALKFRGKFRGIFRKSVARKNISCKIHSADVPP